MTFTLDATAADSAARGGTLRLPRATVATPAFMPVGTRGSVRTQAPDQVAALGVRLLLANTYHLVQRPGLELLRRVGGLARWMDWDGAVLTDSGGFQVFSLAHACTIDDTGARFRPHRDGPTVTLTPESAIAAQEAIGSDVMMVLDHCVAATSDRAITADAMVRTHAWAARCLAARRDPERRLFAIVQGGGQTALRRTSADALTAIDGFDGYAIGGLAVGEPRAQREELTALVAERLPRDRPRYLMGVGTPIDLLEGVHRGVDLFDCILPTAMAQQGVAFTSIGRVELRRGVYAGDDGPLDPACACAACARLPRSYLHHLIKTAEPTGWSLLASHNLRFYVALMATIRAAIAEQRFAALYRTLRPTLEADDPAHPPGPPPQTTRARARMRGAFAFEPGSVGDDGGRLRHLASGEVVPAVDALDAASRIVAVSPALTRARSGAPQVIWDVGLGLAHAAMALIAALDAAPEHGAIELVSVDRDLDALALALAHPRAFPHLRHPAPHRLLARDAFTRPGLTWTVRRGDALTVLADAPAPDEIWWTPGLPSDDASQWSAAMFATLATHLARGGELIVGADTPELRAALRDAGLALVPDTAAGLTRARCP